MDNEAIDPPRLSYFVSGYSLSPSLGLKSEMFPLFVYRSLPCLSRPGSLPRLPSDAHGASAVPASNEYVQTESLREENLFDLLNM